MPGYSPNPVHDSQVFQLANGRWTWRVINHGKKEINSTKEWIFREDAERALKQYLDIRRAIAQKRKWK